MKKLYYANINQKKAGVAILMDVKILNKILASRYNNVLKELYAMTRWGFTLGLQYARVVQYEKSQGHIN